VTHAGQEDDATPPPGAPAPPAPEPAEAAPVPRPVPPAFPDAFAAPPAPDRLPSLPPGVRLVQPYPGAPPVPVGSPAAPPPPSPGTHPSRGDTRPRGLATAALVLAIVGIVAALIPFATWFSGLPLLAAFILGIVAVASRSQGGKPFGIAALVVSVVGWLVSIAMTFVTLAFVAIPSPDADEPPVITSPSPEGRGEETATAVPLVLAESAFGRSRTEPDLWWYVVVLDNPNEDHVFPATDVAIDAVDASGRIVGSTSEFVTLLSGRTEIAGVLYAVEGDVAGIRVDDTAAEAAFAPGAETGSFSFDDLRAFDDGGVTFASGTLSGDFGDDQELVLVSIVARSPDGEIIGGTSRFVDLLPAGGSAPFEVQFLDPLPSDTAFEASATL